MHQKIHLRPSPETVIIEKYFEGDSVLPEVVNISNVEDTLNVHLHKVGTECFRSSQYQHNVIKDGCWGCHKVRYNTEYPYQLDRNWYSLNDGEGCLSCHGSQGATLDPPLEDMSKAEMRNGTLFNLHTQHSEKVSQCVNCHMTKSASIAFQETDRKPYYEFAVHHFYVIRPSLTLGAPLPIGQINTCTEACHRNGRGSRNYNSPTPVAPVVRYRRQGARSME